MKSQHWKTILNLLLIVFILAGCSSQTVVENTSEKEKLVQVQTVKEDTLPVLLKYTGMTSSGEMRKYSFKVPGKLTEINVEKGSAVSSGQKLAAVATSELELGVQASKLKVQKAEKAYTEAKDNYARLEQLFQAGALAQADLNKAKLDLDIKEASYNEAQIDLQMNQNSLNDANLYSDLDGYVVDVLFKKSEIIAAGYPVVVVRTAEQKVTVGISQNDVKKIAVGTVAQIELDGMAITGKVTRIEAVPDPQSRTYNTEIALVKAFPSDKFYLGATTQVKFELGGVSGIWIPLACVLNDGEDYVYEVQDNHAVKKNITLMDTQGFNVRVEGLKPGEQLVITGMKALKEGDKALLQSEGESK
jgi:RND family efflux transporter MFP subunit